MLRYLISVLPLAFEESTNTFIAIFNDARNNLGNSGSMSGAMAFASFVVAIKLIRLGYEAMSDENQGGFGGIRLWSVLKPILLVIAIRYSGFLLGCIDTVANAMSQTISMDYVEAQAKARTERNIQVAMAGVGDADFAAEYREAKLEVDALNSQIRSSVTTSSAFSGGYGAIYYGYKNAGASAEKMKMFEQWREKQISEDEGYQAAVAEAIDNYRNKNVQASYETNVVQGVPDVMDFSGKSLKYRIGDYSKWEITLDDVLKSIKNQYKNKYTVERLDGYIESLTDQGYFEKYSEITKPNDELTDTLFDKQELKRSMKNGTFIMRIARWFYDTASFIILVFSKMTLLILSVFFPWILALSLIEHFKDAYWSFFANYITVSLYLFVLNTIKAITSISLNSFDHLVVEGKLAALESGQAVAKAFGAGLTVEAMLLIAGFILMTKVGSIAGMLMPGGSATAGDAGGGAAAASAAGFVMGKAQQAGGAVLSTPGKVASVVSGRATAANTKATASSLRDAANALGKMSGGGGGGGM